jgi:hypothetical protein
MTIVIYVKASLPAARRLGEWSALMMKERSWLGSVPGLPLHRLVQLPIGL